MLDLEKLAEITIYRPKWQFFYRFWAKMAKTRFFRQNPKMSLVQMYTHEGATLCKKVEKSSERILKSRSDERE